MSALCRASCRRIRLHLGTSAAPARRLPAPGQALRTRCSWRHLPALGQRCSREPPARARVSAAEAKPVVLGRRGKESCSPRPQRVPPFDTRLLPALPSPPTSTRHPSWCRPPQPVLLADPRACVGGQALTAPSWGPQPLAWPVHPADPQAHVEGVGPNHPVPGAVAPHPGLFSAGEKRGQSSCACRQARGGRPTGRSRLRSGRDEFS